MTGSHSSSPSFCSLENRCLFQYTLQKLSAASPVERLPHLGFTILQRGFRWDF
ncbi:MAG: hypothetical protein OJF50_000797 [Nitrospira sp.]|nr:hypothetical protein [Nitrospira sp.]